jgi:hypothetical protein
MANVIPVFYTRALTWIKLSKNWQTADKGVFVGSPNMLIIVTMCQSYHARQYNGGMTTIKLEDAIGTRLARDITEIRPGEFKCPATPMIPKAFAGLPIDMKVIF